MSHIGICVSDWRRSLHFYHDLLGFRYVRELEVSGEAASQLLELDDVVMRAVYLEREGVRIELLHYEQPPVCAEHAPRPMNQLGLTHLSLRVDDLAALLTDLAEAEVEILTQTRIEIPEAQVAAVFVLDPDGTRIELVQQPGD
jgi:glyoxylase I family protein